VDREDDSPILVALSGRPSSAGALEAGLGLAGLTGAPLHILRVETNPDPDDVGRRSPRRLDPRADAVLGDACARAAAAGLRCERDLVYGHPADEIAAVADEVGARLIVVGATTRRTLAGASVPRLLASVSSRPLLVVPDQVREPLSRVLVATNGSSGSKRALTQAVELASALSGELIALEVVSTSDERIRPGGSGPLAYLLEHELRAGPGDRPLAEAELAARSAGVPIRLELRANDSVPEAVARACKRLRPGMLVLAGPTRRLRLRRPLAHRLLARPDVPTLVVPPTGRDQLTGARRLRIAA
jgi:nucleotide-binding universal stress UspA family protein